MDYEKKIDIPFGAHDSELKGWEYTIPEGFTAEIKDGKVIVREKASEDERIRRQLINVCNDYLNGDYSAKPCLNDIKWLKNLLEKQKEQKPAECGEDERIRKWMINQLSAVINTTSAKEFDPTGYEMALKALSWLEKQKEQKSAECGKDEKIRKWLIDYFNDYYERSGDTFCGMQITRILAYLENQKINTEGDFGRGYDCGYEACLNSHGAEWFEKQKDFAADEYWRGFKNGRDEVTENPDRFNLQEKQKEQKHKRERNKPKESWLSKSKYELEHADELLIKRQEELREIRELKNKEQKPAEWSEEDETCLTNILIMLQEYVIHHYSKDDVNKSVDWLKSLPERFNLQPKQEWSEEDITNGWTGVNLERYLSCLQKLGTGNPQQPETINSKWFKEHCRPQPREEIYQSAKHDLAIRFMNYLDENRPEGKMGLSNGECEDIDKAFKEYDWAKIMRYVEKYRSSWKPSEDQMEALKWLVEYMSPSEKYVVIVKNLYEQLKKLM